jgi:hypothetical protein
MLTHLRSNETEKIQKKLAEKSTLSVRISALLKAYGTEQHFLNVWHQNYDSVLARLESSFFVCVGQNADFEELAFFLQFNPYFGSVTGGTDAIEGIAGFFAGGYALRRFDLMARSTDKKGGQVDIPVDAAPSLREVYAVMRQAEDGDFTVGEFPPFYVDVSHRIRHGCARAYLLKQGELPVSACLVSAESDLAGLISGVVTLPAQRGRGFAGAVVQRACNDLLDAHKLPMLECLPNLTGYYERLGFEKVGSTATLTVENR